MAHTSKTDKVLGLFGGGDSFSNPALRPPEKEAVQPVFIKSSGSTQLVNIAYILVNEQLGGIMERFNCCTCDSCVKAVAAEALKVLPTNIVRVKRKSDEDAVNRAAAEMRSEAVRVITKAVIFIKSNPKH